MVRDAPDGAVLDIRVIPRAGRTQVAGTRENAILIRLAAPPVDGAANSELVAFLAGVLRVPKHQVTIVSGEKGRAKRVKVLDVSAEAVRQRLGLA